MSDNPPKLDTLLASWPLKRSHGSDSRVDPEMDFTESVLSRLDQPRKDENTKILLAPSLSESNNTGSEGESPRHSYPQEEDKAMSAPNRRSFKDLAKLANSPSAPPSSIAAGGVSARSEDSGVIDLQAAMPASQSVPVGAPLSVPAPANSVMPPSMNTLPASIAAPVGMAPMAPPSAPPSSSPFGAQIAPPSMPAAYAPVIPSAPALPSTAIAAPMMTAPTFDMTPAPKKKSSGLLIGGAVMGLVALAAGAFLVVKTTRENTSATVTPEKSPVVVAAVAPKTETPSVAKADENVENVQGADPLALPASAAAKTRPVVAAHGAAQVDTRLPPPVVKEEAPVAKAEPKKSVGGPVGALGEEMRKAAGASDKEEAAPEAKGPQFAAGTVPQKPSQGAVTSALSSVLGSARGCAEADTVSRATVVFTSVGTVQSVSISGDAAGKPAAECMKNAISRAKVAPFAESTFTTSVTIRK